MKPPPGVLAPPPATSQPASPPAQSELTSSEVDVEEVENTFSELVDNYFSDKNRDEMKRRFSVLFVSWRQGGYNLSVQQLLAEVGGSLMKGDIGGAEARFTVLGADWSSIVGPNNILIIKKLITAAREKSEKNEDSCAVTKPL